MIPDYFEAVTAYRCWDVFPNGLLCGQAVQEPWPPYQAMVARCAVTLATNDGTRGYEAHVSQQGRWIEAPAFKCDCGIHVYKTPAEAEKRITNDPNGNYYMSRPDGRAWGALKIWGKLVEHETGYRAQFAYPSALLCESTKLANRITALYGVPCEVKKLERPKDAWADDAYAFKTYWYQSAGPFTISSKPVVSIALTPRVQQPGLIQQPSLTQINSLGASSYQKQEAARAAANRAAYFQKDWREIMKGAFHVKKDDKALA